MTKISSPANFTKHTSKNPIQKFLINNFFSSLISLVKPLGADSILDAGCGEGFTMNKLLENNLAKKIEGIEYSNESVNFGKKLFPNLVIKQANIYELPYKDNSFDLMMCTEVLEHLEKPTKALEEMLRVSKKYLIISVPNEPFFMLSNFLRGKNLSRLGNDMEHINHWNCFSFKKYLTKNGIKVKKIVFPYPWMLILGEK
jgi:2-polyprenyl-3-methyl-5-hydroxy-6-metoxy-1,4-benzoquinol methylase